MEMSYINAPVLISGTLSAARGVQETLMSTFQTPAAVETPWKVLDMRHNPSRCVGIRAADPELLWQDFILHVGVT